MQNTNFSKGDLMNKVYDNDYRGVDSALPQPFVDEVHKLTGYYLPDIFVMDYKDGGHGKLVNLGQKYLEKFGIAEEPYLVRFKVTAKAKNGDKLISDFFFSPMTVEDLEPISVIARLDDHFDLEGITIISVEYVGVNYHGYLDTFKKV